jgi:hypothetical protein
MGDRKMFANEILRSTKSNTTLKRSSFHFSVPHVSLTDLARTRAGRTWLNVVVSICVVGFLLSLMLPGIQGAREAGRFISEDIDYAVYCKLLTPNDADCNDPGALEPVPGGSSNSYDDLRHGGLDESSIN